MWFVNFIVVSTGYLHHFIWPKWLKILAVLTNDVKNCNFWSHNKFYALKSHLGAWTFGLLSLTSARWRHCYTRRIMLTWTGIFAVSRSSKTVQYLIQYLIVNLSARTSWKFVFFFFFLISIVSELYSAETSVKWLQAALILMLYSTFTIKWVK